MKKIIIIDYGCGNILSIARAIEHIGYIPEITDDKNRDSQINKFVFRNFMLFSGIDYKLKGYTFN